MKKTDFYKIFAIGLVLVFGIQMVAIGFLSGPGTQNSGNGDGTDNGQALDGTIKTYVTIVRYEPYLIVEGSSPEIEKVKQALIDSGNATYAVLQQDSLIVNLKSSKLVPGAAAKFEQANATVTASAVISTPGKMKLVGDGITTDVEGTSFSMQIRPLFEEGSSVPASFSARTIGGQLASLSDFTFEPQVVIGAEAPSVLLEVKNDDQYVYVSWEGRNEAKQAVLDSGASYKMKSYAIVAGNATTAQLDASKILPYVTAAQTGIVSIKNDFTDLEQARSDLTGLNLYPEFPPSVASFNGSEVGNANALSETLAASGINATVKSTSRAKFRLPDSVESNGKSYGTGGVEIQIEDYQGEANATNVTLVLDFEATGNVISRIIGVRVA